MIKKISSLLILPLFLSSPISAQANQTETSLWTDIEIKYQINKKFETSITPQIRYNFTDNSIKWYVADIDLSAKINKKIKTSASYRYKTRDDATQHNLLLNFYFNSRKKPIRPKYRLRYNKKFRYGENEGVLERKRDKDHIRNRVLFEYTKYKKYKPYIGAELFYLIDEINKNFGFDIFRYYLGVEIGLKKKKELEISWVYEEVFNLGNLSREHIFKVGYSFDLN